MDGRAGRTAVGEVVLGGVGEDRHGSCAGSKGVLDEDFVAGSCEQNADRGFIAAVVSAGLFDDDLDVGRELANIAAVGFADLQLEHDEPAEAEVVKE